MLEEEKEIKKKTNEAGVTRRQFLAGTGIVVGGAALGSSVILVGCGGEATKTITDTVTDTVTTTAPGVTETVTTTETVGPAEVEGLVSMKVNGQEYALAGVKPHWSLAFILREKLGLTGTKIGCDRGTCGTCTVLQDGKAIYSCSVPVVQANGSEIQTVEGLSDGITLNPVQQAFYDNSAVQCGYCTPGFLMAAQALLNSKSSPSRAEVNEALSGHICTCGHYIKVVDAVLSV